MIYIDKSQLRIVWIATNHNLIKRKFSLGKISDIIALGKNFFGRFSSEYTSGQIYIARNFFLQSNTRVCRSKLPSGWSPRVIFLRQTLVCQDCSKKFPAIYLSLGILYMRIALKCHMIYIDKSQLRIVWIATNHNLIKRKFSLGKISDIIALGKNFFGRFSSEYTSGQIYIARNFFLQSNTRVCRSKLPSG
jgi:hypothetical protein